MHSRVPIGPIGPISLRRTGSLVRVDPAISLTDVDTCESSGLWAPIGRVSSVLFIFLDSDPDACCRRYGCVGARGLRLALSMVEL